MHERFLEQSRNSPEIEKSQFWHGTGRYQYDSNGKIIDVFTQMLDDGGLVPHLDLYDLSHPMTTVSLANDRNYALLYADMHSTNPEALERNMLKHEAVDKYIKDVKREAIRWYLGEFGFLRTVHMGLKMRKNLAVDNRWSKKINRDEPSIAASFVAGSDIPGNYPVLLGVSQISSQTVIAPYLAKHEVRTNEVIPMSAINHIEVPDEHIKETRKLLRNHRLLTPVISLEAGEKLFE